MADYNVNNLVTLGALQTLAQKTKSALDGIGGEKYGDASVANGKLNFYAKAGDATPLKSIDLPAEKFLDLMQTGFVNSFAFNETTYPGATNPNLDGKPVLVLALKNEDSSGTTISYSFANLAHLIDTVNISATAGNLLENKADGLFVGSDDTKVDKVTGKQLSTEDYTTAEKTKLAGIEDGAQVNIIESVNVDGTALAVTSKGVNIDLSGKVDKVTSAVSGNVANFGANGVIVDSGVTLGSKVDKVTNAVAGNFAVFGASGAIADSGVKFASDQDVAAMIAEYFPNAGGSSVNP